MRTEIEIIENNTPIPKPTPEIGQFWKHETGSLWLLVITGEGYVLVSVKNGSRWAPFASKSIKGAFSDSQSEFTFVPKVTITIC